MSWRDFWNDTHSIYVSERHRLLHYDRVAKDIAAFIPAPDASVLDHGCGEANAASFLSQRCARLYLFDAAPKVQMKLQRGFAHIKNITVLGEEQFFALPDDSLDLIVCNSVLQYIGADETHRLMQIWHDKLKTGGRLVLGDILPPDLSMLDDVKALLTFAWQGGFTFAALNGLVKTFFSNYRHLREEIGLSTYSEDDMLTLLSKHRFCDRRAPRNIGHHQKRMTFIGTKI